MHTLDGRVCFLSIQCFPEECKTPKDTCITTTVALNIPPANQTTGRSQCQFLTEWSRSACKYSPALIAVGQRHDAADRYLTNTLPAFEMLEYSASCLHIFWFGEVRIVTNRCSEVAQDAIDPSILFGPL